MNNAKSNIQLIKSIMERCKHFTGLTEKMCNQHILYESFNSVSRLPCLSQGDKCPRATFPSMEGAILEEQDQKRRTHAKRLLAQSSLMRGKGKDHKTV